MTFFYKFGCGNESVKSWKKSEGAAIKRVKAEEDLDYQRGSKVGFFQS